MLTANNNDSLSAEGSILAWRLGGPSFVLADGDQEADLLLLRPLW